LLRWQVLQINKRQKVSGYCVGRLPFQFALKAAAAACGGCARSCSKRWGWLVVWQKYPHLFAGCTEEPANQTSQMIKPSTSFALGCNAVGQLHSKNSSDGTRKETIVI
jgi:hypothetical protein